MNDAFLWAKNDAPVADIEEWAILMAYAERADDDGCNAYQSIPTIAKRARISEKTVSRRLKEMVDRGLLVRGDQRAVEHLPVGKRPVVYDMQIPAAWFPNLDRINEYRARMRRPAITEENRPQLAAAPEPKKRADAGKPRLRAVEPGDRTTSPPLTGLQVPPPETDNPDVLTGLVVRAGTTSPPTLGVTRGLLETPSSPPPSEKEKTEISSQEENQETKPETAEDVKSKEFFPVLTPWERELLDEVLRVAPLWGSGMATKVIGSKRVREVTQRDPGLVRRAFLIGARDRRTNPMRMWHIEGCPHWKRAASELAAEEVEKSGSAPAEGGQEPVAARGSGSPAAGRYVPAPAAAFTKSGPNEEWRRAREELAARKAPDKAG